MANSEGNMSTSASKYVVLWKPVCIPTSPVLSHPLQAPLSSYITQTKQLVKDVRKLQNELMETSSHIEQLLNNCMEQLLVLMAKKQGIQWETGEAERQEEQEELSHLYYNRLLHLYKLNLCNVC